MRIKCFMKNVTSWKRIWQLEKYSELGKKNCDEKKILTELENKAMEEKMCPLVREEHNGEERS